MDGGQLPLLLYVVLPSRPFSPGCFSFISPLSFCYVLHSSFKPKDIAGRRLIKNTPDARTARATTHCLHKRLQNPWFPGVRRKEHQRIKELISCVVKETASQDIGWKKRLGPQVPFNRFMLSSMESWLACFSFLHDWRQGWWGLRANGLFIFSLVDRCLLQVAPNKG